MAFIALNRTVVGESIEEYTIYKPVLAISYFTLIFHWVNPNHLLGILMLFNTNYMLFAEFYMIYDAFPSGEPKPRCCLHQREFQFPV